ncbi:helicase [Microbacterium insulae]|uniref:Helicase n=1 Tax=Microbacterium insulae TaxID=483014 RepID=A0ABW3AJQ3_9MICO
MAGSSLAVGVMGVAAVVAVGLTGVPAAAVAGQRLAGAADAAALAAADAASGAATGVPCERAEQTAAAWGARVTECGLDGLVATVSVAVQLGPISARASARAGPPS